METNKVIEVLENISGYFKFDEDGDPRIDNTVLIEILTQAISMIKENEHLIKVTEEQNDTIIMVDAKNKELETENGELRKENENLTSLLNEAEMVAQDYLQELTELKAKYEELEKDLKYKRRLVSAHKKDTDANYERYINTVKELADLKKAVASEGLGVVDIEKIIRPMINDYASNFDIAEAIVEAQTKYKKGGDV